MGVLDKIKNALFEVEYVEVEEPPKSPKKKKNKNKEKEDKPIAKKIVLPGKKEEKIQELEEEELRDEDFEIRPRDEVIKEKPHEEFKFMDDKDFQMEEDIIPDEPEIVHVLDDTVEEKEEKIPVKEEIQSRVSRTREEKNERHYDFYQEEVPPVQQTSPALVHEESKPYGVDNSYRVAVHEYGTYEKKEEKPYFKPSPIISPIYGVLDRNYRKEDVKEKQEVRITTNYSRSNVSVDDIRNKAYGKKGNSVNAEEKKEEALVDTKFEVEEDDDDNLLVDLSDRAKPEVKELTVGDALEYFQDLGLEYNVDYVDVSKENNKKKETRVSRNEEKVVKNSDVEDKKKEEKKSPVQEKKESNSSSSIDDKNDDNDNLFDLIDSMYQESD